MNHPYRPLQDVPNSGPETAVNDPVHPKRSPAEAMVELLALEGCHPSVGDQGEIRFVHKEVNYLLLLSRTDPEFVRLILPSFYAVENDSDRAIAYAAANIANGTCKAAKVYVERGQTHAAIECFLSSPLQFVPVLMRSAGALENAARSFAIACSLQQRG